MNKSPVYKAIKSMLNSVYMYKCSLVTVGGSKRDKTLINNSSSIKDNKNH